MESSTEKKETIMNKILGAISGSFAPILGVLAGSALITALLSLLKTLGWISPESGTYADSFRGRTCYFLLLPDFSRNYHGH